MNRKYQVDESNNFCRVFELPDVFSGEFCFDGGIATNFQMVDWFTPVCRSIEELMAGVEKMEVVTDEYIHDKIIPFIKGKNYVKKNKNYLVLFEFGASTQFKGE